MKTDDVYRNKYIYIISKNIYIYTKLPQLSIL